MGLPFPRARRHATATPHLAAKLFAARDSVVCAVVYRVGVGTTGTGRGTKEDHNRHSKGMRDDERDEGDEEEEEEEEEEEG